MSIKIDPDDLPPVFEVRSHPSWSPWPIDTVVALPLCHDDEDY